MRTMSGGPCLHYDCSNRNSFGYCRTTVCINEHYQQEQWGSPSTTNKSESVVKKPQTNADRIRAMTDEELAEFIGRCVDHEFQFECVCFLNQFGYCQYPTRGCNENALEWLKQPYNEKGENI